jgi:hypothetical protein
VSTDVSFSSQISHLVRRPDFDLAWSRHGIGAAPHPGGRLVHVLDFPEPEAGDQLAGPGERPVDDRTAGTIERNTLLSDIELDDAVKPTSAHNALMTIELRGAADSVGTLPSEPSSASAV